MARHVHSLSEPMVIVPFSDDEAVRVNNIIDEELKVHII